MDTIPKPFRVAVCVAIAVCLVASCAFMLSVFRDDESQASRHDAEGGSENDRTLTALKADVEAAKLRLERMNSLLTTVRDRGERYGLPNRVVAPVLAPIQRERDKALLRSLQEQVNYRMAAFDASDTEVLTNFGSLREATKVMTQLFGEGIETQCRPVSIAGVDQPETIDLLVRRSEAVQARQELLRLQPNEVGAGSGE